MESTSVGLDANGVPRDYIAAAHELGHILIGPDHGDITTVSGAINLMAESGHRLDSPVGSKRLTVPQITRARGF